MKTQNVGFVQKECFRLSARRVDASRAHRAPRRPTMAFDIHHLAELLCLTFIPTHDLHYFNFFFSAAWLLENGGGDYADSNVCSNYSGLEWKHMFATLCCTDVGLRSRPQKCLPQFRDGRGCKRMFATYSAPRVTGIAPACLLLQIWTALGKHYRLKHYFAPSRGWDCARKHVRSNSDGLGQTLTSAKRCCTKTLLGV